MVTERHFLKVGESADFKGVCIPFRINVFENRLSVFRKYMKFIEKVGRNA